MASSKTKRMATIAALSAALMLGGVAAAQAGGDDASQKPCVHGQGKGMGTGAPGNDKGNGAERGWPHGCKPKKDKDDGENEAKDKKDKKDKKVDNEQDDDTSGGDGTETPSGGTETPSGGTETPSGAIETPAANVDVSIDIENLPGPAVKDVENLLLGILTPAVQNAASATLQTAGQATELVTNDAAATVGLLEGAGAVSVGDGPAAEAEVTIPLSGVVSIAGGTTRAVTGIVAGMVFAV